MLYYRLKPEASQNALHLHYKDQSVSAAHGNGRYTF
jgi:hypothetical protein